MFLAYAVVGSTIIIIASFVRRVRDKYDDICVAIGLTVACIAPLAPGRLIGVARPLTFDGYLYFADRFLGLDILPFARLAYSTPWVWQSLQVVYDALPLALALAWAFERPKHLRAAVVLSGVACLFCYLVVPACGAAHAFPGFPWALINPSGLIAVPPEYPRNCFPSMHLGWALVLMQNAQSKKTKIGFGLFALLTGLATVASGEHYFVDLLADVPFVAGTQWLAENWRNLGFLKAPGLTRLGAIPILNRRGDRA